MMPRDGKKPKLKMCVQQKGVAILSRTTLGVRVVGKNKTIMLKRGGVL